MRYLASVLLVLAACTAGKGSSATGADASAADVPAATGPKPFGMPCAADSECAGGLCLASDYAPFRFCTAPCTVHEEGCPPVEGEAVTGFCTKFPDTFTAVTTPICLPLCSGLPTCQGFSTLWERCDPPAYKGQVIYGSASGVRVCGAPSSHGKPVVNPKTCAGWSTAYTAEYGTQVSVCNAYCDYLATCGVLPEGANLDCCAYGCFQRAVTSDGDIDAPYEKLVKCFITSFDGHEGTVLHCTAPPDDCGAEPQDPTPPS